jgi:hypothetical protein
VYHRPVQITARLEEATVKELLSELLPATIDLDEEGEKGRWIRIDEARHVDFVSGEGLRVETGGQLQWSAAGLPISVTFQSAQLMLRPVVVEDEHGGRLVFKPALEALDLKNVPGFVDRGVLSIVNGRLDSQGDSLAWPFGQTLTVSVDLPPTLEPVDKLQLGVRSAQVVVLPDAIVFTVSFSMAFTRGAQKT